MEKIPQEEALSLYILFLWKFQSKELFFQANYNIDASFIRHEFMEEARLKYSSPRIPDIVKLRDELSRKEVIGRKICWDIFHVATFEQSDKNMEKMVQVKTDIDSKSDEDLIREYFENLKINIPDSHKVNCAYLFDLVENMYSKELGEQKLKSSKDKSIFILEKMVDELAMYTLVYGIQYDYKTLYFEKYLQNRLKELEIFKLHVKPLFECIKNSEMDEDDIEDVVSKLLYYFSRVKKGYNISQKRYKYLYGEKGTKKVATMAGLQDQYDKIKLLKLKPLHGESGKINRAEFLTNLFNTTGLVKQFERQILGKQFQPDIVSQNTMEKWIKSKI